MNVARLYPPSERALQRRAALRVPEAAGDNAVGFLDKPRCRCNLLTTHTYPPSLVTYVLFFPFFQVAS